MKSDFIEKDVFELILELVPYDVAIALRVSLETGLRIGDVLALKPENITDNKISVIAQKTRKPMCAEIPKEYARYLERHAVWCFPSPRDATKHRTRQSVWACVKRAVSRLSIAQNVTPHTARKIFAVERFKRKGLRETQDALQHDSVSTTLLYAFADKLDGRGKRAHQTMSKGDADRIIHEFIELLGGAEKVLDAMREVINEKDTT